MSAVENALYAAISYTLRAHFIQLSESACDALLRAQDFMFWEAANRVGL